jgi:hypothetical protein
MHIPLPRELDKEERLGKGIRYSVIGTPPCELEHGEIIEKEVGCSVLDTPSP